MSSLAGSLAEETQNDTNPPLHSFTDEENMMKEAGMMNSSSLFVYISFFFCNVFLEVGYSILVCPNQFLNQDHGYDGHSLCCAHLWIGLKARLENPPDHLTE